MLNCSIFISWSYFCVCYVILVLLTQLTGNRQEASTTSLRRSARSTKGQHSRFAAEEAEILAAAKKATTAAAAGCKVSQSHKKKKISKSGLKNTRNSDLVRCICQKVVENDTQLMAQCEKCFTWQHVKCLFGKEDGNLLPDVYCCSNCQPLSQNNGLKVASKAKLKQPYTEEKSKKIKKDTSNAKSIYMPGSKKSKSKTVSFRKAHNNSIF